MSHFSKCSIPINQDDEDGGGGGGGQGREKQVS